MGSKIIVTNEQCVSSDERDTPTNTLSSHQFHLSHQSLPQLLGIAGLLCSPMLENIRAEEISFAPAAPTLTRNLSQEIGHFVSVTGEITPGTLIDKTEDSYSFELPTGGRATLPMRDILSLQIGSKEISPHQKNIALMTLQDGSILRARQEDLVGEDFSIQIPWLVDRLTISTSQIRNIRLQQGEQHSREWEANIHMPPTAADRLILLKKGKLFSVEGVVLGMTRTHILFQLNEKEYQVARERVYGIIYFEDKKREPNRSEIFHLSIGAERIPCSDFSIDTSCNISLVLASGETIQLKPKTRCILDFAPSIQHALSLKSPTILSWEPLQGLTSPGSLSDQTLFGETQPVTSENSAVRFDGQTEVCYELNQQFRYLRAELRWSSSYSKSETTIIFFGDEKPLVEVNAATLQDDSCSINIDLSNISELKIQIDGPRPASLERCFLIR